MNSREENLLVIIEKIKEEFLRRGNRIIELEKDNIILRNKIMELEQKSSDEYLYRKY